MPVALVASSNSSLADLHILPADNKPLLPFYGLQIIQLEEALPPPAHKAISSSSFASSSSYYSSSYASDSEACSDEDMEGESYCSSDDEGDEEDNVPGSIQSPETYALRMKRVLAWRECFDAASSFLVQESATTPSVSLKRKRSEVEEEEHSSVEDNTSHTSKRSRSSQYSAESVGFNLAFLGISSSPSSSLVSLPCSTESSSPSLSTSVSASSLPLSPSHSSPSSACYSCTACDASFETPERLREHGVLARESVHAEACAVAVEYAFE